MEELISVVVPIYNVEKYLQKCIDSILAQTYRHLEIILVDDGSPDNCGAICDNYAQEDGRVLVIHKKNGGLSSARNAGLEIAKGELIVFIDSDDWIDANYIEKLYDDISESGADVAVPAFCISFENGDCAVDSRVKEVTTYSKKEALEVFLFNGYLTPCVASKMWKKSLWQKIRCPVSICFYAMKYILNKDAKRYFLAVLIAFLFHKSALFFVPVYFLQYLKFDFKKAITIVGLTVLSGSGLFAILKFIIKYTPYAFYFTLNSVELNEIVASQSSILFFGVSTIIGYYYYSKEKEIDTKTQLLYNMQIISLSIALMTAFVPLINRVLYYGMAYELLYLPNMLKLINNRREKMLVKVFLILMYGGITAYGMINSGWYTCIPYNFYFDYR